MGKTPTKNPNLWSDNTLQMKYNQLCRELIELVRIARQVKVGTYDGPMNGLLDKKNLVNVLGDAKNKVLNLEKYIHRREEFYKKQGQPSPFKL